MIWAIVQIMLNTCSLYLGNTFKGHEGIQSEIRKGLGFEMDYLRIIDICFGSLLKGGSYSHLTVILATIFSGKIKKSLVSS